MKLISLNQTNKFIFIFMELNKINYIIEKLLQQVIKHLNVISEKFTVNKCRNFIINKKSTSNLS